MTRRQQLLTLLHAERQCLQITPPGLHPSLEAIIAAIKAQLDDIELQRVGHVREHYGQARQAAEVGQWYRPCGQCHLDR
ncbi:hypothetical protein GCM10027514_19150 [Azotobacter armeniacus]